MRPDTVTATAPTLPTAPAPTGAARAACWYADPAHRPSLAWSPVDCQGVLAWAERTGDGSQHTYCDAHGAWRRETVRLPSLVRRVSATG
jgi:hypothetical protein